MIGVGQAFPAFELEGVNAENNITTINSWDLEGWTVVYFYPKDFTFICPTEIADFDALHDEDDGVSVVGISGDNEFCKQAWRNVNGMIREINHPLAADSGLYLGDQLGIVDEQNGVHFRATYILDDEGIIQHMSVNALDTGRNANEVHRTLEALRAGGLTGCNWEPGDDFVA